MLKIKFEKSWMIKLLWKNGFNIAPQVFKCYMVNEHFCGTSENHIIKDIGQF